MIVGVPSEVKDDEYRVALTPAGARELTGAGHDVLVERGAGVGSSITDADFIATGAKIVERADDVWSDGRPRAQGEGADRARVPAPRRASQDQVLFTYLHLAASRACTDALLAAGNTAIAYETVRLPDNSLPLLTPMSEVAGRMAPLMGAHHLMRSGRRTRHAHLRRARRRGRPTSSSSAPGVSGMAAATLAVGHARERAHLRQEPRAPPPDRPPLPRRGRDRGVLGALRSRRPASTPTS